MDEAELSGSSWSVVGLPFRHRGCGFDIGSDRALASGVAFAAEFTRTGGTIETGSLYDLAVGLYRDELLQSQVVGRLLARLMAVLHDVRAGRLSDELPVAIVRQRSGLPQDGGFLRALGTHQAERISNPTWVGMARQLLTLSLLSSSNSSMESFGVKESCLKCGAASTTKQTMNFHCFILTDSKR